MYIMYKGRYIKLMFGPVSSIHFEYLSQAALVVTFRQVRHMCRVEWSHFSMVLIVEAAHSANTETLQQGGLKVTNGCLNLTTNENATHPVSLTRTCGLTYHLCLLLALIIGDYYV